MRSIVGAGILVTLMNSTVLANDDMSIRITPRAADQMPARPLTKYEEEAVREGVDRCLRGRLRHLGDLDGFPSHVVSLDIGGTGVITRITSPSIGARNDNERHQAVSSFTMSILDNPACRKLKHTPARQQIRLRVDVEINPPLLAQKWSRDSASKCATEGIVVARKQQVCSFSLTDDGGLTVDGNSLEDPVVVTSSSDGERVHAKKLMIYPPSPSGRFVFLQACADNFCWAERMIDRTAKRIFKTSSSKYGPSWVIWSPDEKIALFGGGSSEGEWITIIYTHDGKAEVPKFLQAFRDRDAIMFKESFRWENDRAFSVEVKYCPSQDVVHPEYRGCVSNHKKHPKQRLLVRY